MMKRLIGVLMCIFLMTSLTLVTAAANGDPPEVPPGAGMGVEPGYTRYEPGHWELTDKLYLGSIGEERTVNGLTVTTALENENKDIVYTFTDSDGAQAVYTVTPYWFEERYYAEDRFEIGVNMTRVPDEDSAPGGVSASVVIADVTLGEGKYGFDAEVLSYFERMDGTEVKKFSVKENMRATSNDGEKYAISLCGEFPVGETAGQKLYAMVGTQDDIDRETRIFMAWEYEWIDEPEEIEVPPQYGPIEYFDTPVKAAFYFAPFIIGAVLVIAVILIVVFLRKKRRNKRNS